MLLHGEVLQGVHGLLMWGAFAANGSIYIYIYIYMEGTPKTTSVR